MNGKYLQSTVGVCIMMLLLTTADCKIVKRQIHLHSLSMKTHTVFLTKFDIGTQTGNFTIQYRLSSPESDFNLVSLSVGLLIDDNFKNFMNKGVCQQKMSLYSQMQKLNFFQSSWGSTSFQIEKQSREHIWYLYIFDCNLANVNKQPAGTVSLDITMFNNQSHFGEDENLLTGYIVLVIIWIGLLIYLMLPIIRSLQLKSTSWAQILIYISFLILGLTYFYRLLDLIMIAYYGEEIIFLTYFYTILKYLIEGIMVTVIVSIAWGWSLTHLKHEQYYILMGAIVTIFNLMAIILDLSAEEIEEAHHHYDRLIGFLILLIRLFIFGVFAFGILRSMAQSVSKIRHFIRRFGYLGGTFLLAWPTAVIFCELFLPNYMHNEVVTLVEEGVYIIANAYMCRLFAFPDADFKKVKIKDDDEDYIVPDYVRKK